MPKSVHNARCMIMPRNNTYPFITHSADILSFWWCAYTINRQDHFIMRLLFILLLLAVMPTHTARAETWNALEIRTMPPYCAGRFAREQNDMQEYKRWEAKYGPDFLHVHHLCHAIGNLEILYPRARNEQDRRNALNAALGHLGYMLNHAKPDFALMSDVHLYRGIAFVYQKNEAVALKEFLKAIELDPKSVPAYQRAANTYARLGKKDLALDTVTKGLQHVHGSRILQRLYHELGGRLPYPEPVGKTQKPDSSDRPGEANQASGPNEINPARADTTTPTERSAVVYSFSKEGQGGMQHGYNAGNYVFMEVTEDPKAPTARILFKITTQIPQPHSRIQSIAFGLGRHVNLFTRLEPDQLLGVYYPVIQQSTPYRHPFWPNFEANYLLEFRMDPEIRKPNDARRLSPGSSLVIKADLSPGVTYEDVIQALNRGLQYEDGLRVAIIPHHLAGPPLPTGTRSDDGGYFTGRLLQATGPIAKTLYSDSRHTVTNKKAMEPDQTTDSQGNPSGTTNRRSGDTSSQDEPVTPAPDSKSRNPWCRFCPVE